MYGRVVIAVDGSDEARGAARHGLAVAHDFDATVDLLYVIEQKAVRLTETAEEKTQLHERGEQALADIGDLAATFGVSVTTTLLEGKPASRISRYASEQDADLIVIGRQGSTGVGRRLLGGVTEHILHRSNVPVLVVPPVEQRGSMDPEYSRVLLTTDGSENAEVAIPHTIAIAARYGSEVHVLNVVDLQAAGGLFHAGGLETEFMDRLDERGEAAVDRVAAEISKSATEVEISTAVRRTDSFEGAAAGIREFVEEADIDLIVMGSHGRSNLKRQLLGSVASTVLRIVDVPVLVVKRPA